MNFRIINKKDWDRKEYFEHYFSEVSCTYSMTVKLDITKIKNSNQKLYPTILYFITKVVNKHNEFRTSFNMNGQLGVFEEMIPCYTVFHKDTETFSNIWTEYSENYDIFCKSYEKDMQMFSSVKGLIAKPDIPANNFPVSMVPWTSFDGFNLNLQKGYEYLLPIFTIGKYYKENGRYLLPLAIQVHHAVCDGFHVCRFVNELQELIKG
ncbi:type A chloramphenicol O-acetyltransferase [Clostridium botulinum]|uniref:Chloramphenicol acetyltransferase n=1 Tax=Clostridium botulinum (strain Okra / Type B1) TaxID=498213 RepID=B1IES5_CLOBK|nr:type A chloramphenicol O-acetyltransferase [Clostridium botulinum]EKX78157.1 chloramphenicol O-acetyltransferase [Clostridium botulinum CFSAN001628]ACA46359.1 chloramphenicol O-acetyltransferase [Clostridium botulinum B1 str. Okra]MBD5561604.1 type A chloramphenicol O-acetyltransferase [Clostridium botulinum]MBD5565273.1 type A chloramphenicol O-acetyltransferase [Clostridium botulinum]MBD5570723.1 type A chloramphenicol O-acetyltransferase [Clostridium botulinum]